MDDYCKELQDALIRLGQTPEKYGEKTEHEVKHLLHLLSAPDEAVFREYYGLFGTEVYPLEDIARRCGVSPQTLSSIIEKDLRKIAITPEWQQIVKPHLIEK